VTELANAQKQDGARLSPSGLELYLTRETAAKKRQIYKYSRAATTDPWDGESFEAALSVPAADAIKVESEGSFLTFLSETTAYLSVYQRPSAASIYGISKLFVTTRLAKGDAWGVPKNLAIDTATGTEEFPSLNATKNKLYFVRGDLGTYRIYVSDVLSPTSFSTPMPLIFGLGTTTSQYAPVLSGADLYFTGASGRTIYRSTATGPAKDPTLNTAGMANTLTWISPNACEAYLTVDDKIFRARKLN
jgi:hypothetical protein